MVQIAGMAVAQCAQGRRDRLGRQSGYLGFCHQIRYALDGPSFSEFAAPRAPAAALKAQDRKRDQPCDYSKLHNCDAVAGLARRARKKGWTPADGVRILFSCVRTIRAGIGGCGWAIWQRMK